MLLCCFHVCPPPPPFYGIFKNHCLINVKDWQKDDLLHNQMTHTLRLINTALMDGRNTKSPRFKHLKCFMFYVKPTQRGESGLFCWLHEISSLLVRCKVTGLAGMNSSVSSHADSLMQSLRRFICFLQVALIRQAYAVLFTTASCSALLNLKKSRGVNTQRAKYTCKSTPHSAQWFRASSI